jgi:hypothetical protein
VETQHKDLWPLLWNFCEYYYFNHYAVDVHAAQVA